MRDLVAFFSGLLGEIRFCVPPSCGVVAGEVDGTDETGPDKRHQKRDTLGSSATQRGAFVPLVYPRDVVDRIWVLWEKTPGQPQDTFEGCIVWQVDTVVSVGRKKDRVVDAACVLLQSFVILGAIDHLPNRDRRAFDLEYCVRFDRAVCKEDSIDRGQKAFVKGPCFGLDATQEKIFDRRVCCLFKFLHGDCGSFDPKAD